MYEDLIREADARLEVVRAALYPARMLPQPQSRALLLLLCEELHVLANKIEFEAQKR